MNKNNISSIVLTILVLVALGVGVMLVRQSQNLQRGASFTTAALSLLPSDKITANVGDTFPVYINYVAEAGKFVDAVQATVCYGNQVEVAKVVASTNLGFDASPIVAGVKVGNQDCTTAVFTASQPLSNLKNLAKVGIIYFAAGTAGDGNITIVKDRSMVTGDNGASLDKEVAISSVVGTSYSISQANVGPGPTFNFKVSFVGVKKANLCADHMTAGLVVKAVGESKVYSGIQFTRTDQVTASGFSIYTGTKVLSGFNFKTGVAAFFKGMKHLQMKYGKGGQVGSYGKDGGELDLTDSTKVYDFTGYPMLAGDVNQDGWVNADDFSLMKTKIQTHETVVEGDANAIYDLDGSCQLNTMDVGWLAESLNAKQGELY